jgi:Fe-S-cluster containining protein
MRPGTQRLRFSCTQCGNCCGGAPGYVWVDAAEIERIAAHLSMSAAEFTRRHTRRERGGLSLLERPDGDCEFLVRLAGGKSECSIHAVRPTQCRTWPFWESNLRNEKSWERAARNCPGMDHGTHHPLPVIQDALRANTAARLPL